MPPRVLICVIILSAKRDAVGDVPYNAEIYFVEILRIPNSELITQTVLIRRGGVSPSRSTISEIIKIPVVADYVPPRVLICVIILSAKRDAVGDVPYNAEIYFVEILRIPNSEFRINNTNSRLCYYRLFRSFVPSRQRLFLPPLQP